MGEIVPLGTSPSVGAGAGAGADVVGVVGLGEVTVALAVSVLREVVDRPEHFAPLPAAVDGLLGAMDLRGLAVPVVDLRPRLGITPTRGVTEVVIVVTDGNRMIGVLADRLDTVMRVSAEDLMAVDAAGNDLFFTHTFQAFDTIVSLLDVPKILALPSMPTVADARRRDAGPSRRAVAAVGARAVPNPDEAELPHVHAVLQCGPYVLALDVAHIHTTLPTLHVTPSVVDGRLCRGVTPYVGLNVAVVDPLELLGLPSLPAEHEGPGVVLSLKEGFVVLAVTALLDLADVHDSTVMTVPTATFAARDLISGVTATPTAPHSLLLDGPAMLAHTELRALAATNTDLLHNSGSTTTKDIGLAARKIAGAPHLVYRLDVNIATPLDQVLEIIAMPTVLTQTHSEPSLLGVATHREELVPIYCLATALGRGTSTAEPKSCVLLVEQNGRHVGFAVSGLFNIAPLTWRDTAAPEPGVADDAARAVNDSPLIEVQGVPGLIPQLDLRALATVMCGPVGASESADLQRTAS